MANKQGSKNDTSHYLHFPTEGLDTSTDKMGAISSVLAQPQYPFQNFAPHIEKYLSDIDNSKFAQNLDDPYTEFFDFEIVVTDIIAQNKIDDLFDHPTDPLIILRNCVEKIAPGHIDIIQDTFPLRADLVLESMPKEVRSSFAAIASLLHENSGNDSLIEWLGQTLVSSSWHGSDSATSSKFKLCGIFERHHHGHMKHFAYVTPSNEFVIQRESDRGIVARIQNVDHIDKSRSGKSVRIWAQVNQLGERLVVTDPATLQIWTQRDSPAAISLPFFCSYMPDFLMKEFETALLQPDTLVLRALLHHEVLSMKNVEGKMRNLYYIFAAHKQVHRFISTVSAVEFTATSLDESTVCRSNSHLTHLWKTFYHLYGKPFFQNIIKPIIDHLEEVGNIGLREPSPEICPQVLDLLNWVIDKFLSGAEFITPQLRHMAFVLKSVTATVLRSKRAVFNALSSFLCLRFTNAIITNPHEFDSTCPQPSSADLANIYIPFATLFQLPFNLQLIDGSEKFNKLKDISCKLIDRYEEIYNFIVDASIIDNEKGVLYDEPTEQQVNTALTEIMKEISEHRNNFIHRYIDLYQSENEKTAATFGMSQFIVQLFNK